MDNNDLFYCHLNLQSVYSFLDSNITVDELVHQCKENNYQAVALTDYNNMHNIYNFYNVCVDNDIKPIIGTKVNVVDRLDEKQDRGSFRHCVLLAKNHNGLKDLMKISTFSNYNKYYEARIDYKNLQRLNKDNNIICLTGGSKGDLPSRCVDMESDEQINKTIKWYKKTFKENLYFEIVDNNYYEQLLANERMNHLAKKYNVPIVVTNNVKFSHKSDKETHDLLRAIKSKQDINSPKVQKLPSNCNWFKDKNTMVENMQRNYIKGLINVKKIADSIDSNYYPNKKIYLPKVGTEDQIYSRLKTMCYKNMNIYTQKKSADDKIKYQERLDKELDLIRKYNISSYFLILSDIMRFCRENDIYVGPGRGSAAGSIVAFFTKITKIDSIKYGLIFERFINDGRLATGSLPDIDIDIQDSKRDQVIDYIVKKYGVHNTSHIINFNFLKEKSAIKRVAKSLGIDFELANKITKNLPDDFDIDSMNQKPEVRNYMSQYPDLFEWVRRVKGGITHAGTHAAGILISSENLFDIIPLTKIKDNKTKEEQVTSQFDMKSAEKIGLIKVDVLGVTVESIISDTVKLIQKTHNQDKPINVDRVRINDPIVFETIFDKKLTAGIFQFSSTLMRYAINVIKPQSLEELTIITSIARPGSKEFIPLYAINKFNPRDIKYPDDSLKNILEETKGIIIYQEQVMEICKQYAGFSLEEADHIRRAIGKKILHIIENYRKTFINRAISLGHNRKNTEIIYEMFTKFADYAFNKSHALAYSLIGYQTAWLKTKYPLEYITTLLNHELIKTKATSPEDKLELADILLQDFNFFGIELLPPSINKSYEYFTIEDGNIRYGLAALKDVGMRVATNIVEHRKNKPYKSFLHFMYTNEKKSVPKGALIALIMSGSFSDFTTNRFNLMQEYENIRKIIENFNKLRSKNYKLLPCVKLPSDKQVGLHSDEIHFDGQEILNKEKEIAYFYLTAHPLDAYKTRIEKMDVDYLSDILYMHVNEKVKLVVKVDDVHYITTKNGYQMCFIDAIDYSGRGQITVFPKILSESGGGIGVGSIYKIKGKINEFHGKMKVLAEDIIAMI